MLYEDGAGSETSTAYRVFRGLLTDTNCQGRDVITQASKVWKDGLAQGHIGREAMGRRGMPAGRASGQEGHPPPILNTPDMILHLHLGGFEDVPLILNVAF